VERKFRDDFSAKRLAEDESGLATIGVETGRRQGGWLTEGVRGVKWVV